MLACALGGAVVLPAGEAAAQASTITYLSQFGSQGSGPGQFESPAAIAVNTATGDVYVTDITNDLVEEFNASGSYLSEFGGPGNGNGQFNVPIGIAVDPGSGDVYVLDNSGGFGNEDARIQRFDASGNFQLSWTFSYFEANQIAVDPATGDVYATDDSSNNQVIKFDPSGTQISAFGSTGTGNGQFTEPTTIAVDPSDGDLYVTDTNAGPSGCRVQKFDSSGNFLFQFGGCGSGDGQFGAGGVGNNSDEITGPTGLAVDPVSGDVYAVDSGNNRVEVFDSSGNYLSQFGAQGSGNGQFSNPDGDALDQGTGQLYVVDNGNDRVEVLSTGRTSSGTVTISSSANPSVSGQPVTYTATVSPAPSGGTAAFADNSQPITACNSQPVNTSTGNATCTVSYPGTGSHQIVASFSGTNSQALSQTVNPDATTTKVTSSANPDNPRLSAPFHTRPCLFACPVTFTVTVSANAPGAGTPTGTVQFTIDGRNYGSATLTDGVATSGPIAFTPGEGFTRLGGAHTVTAAYSGDRNFSPSSGQLSELVTTGTYAALGDSYSAGAGVPPYLPGSSTIPASCDQSALAWPYIVNTDLAFSSFSFVACTGSVVQDLTRTNPQTGEPPQENWLCAPSSPPGSCQPNPGIQLVTLTWGGNNAFFAQVMETCISNEFCQAVWHTAVDTAIKAMGTPGNAISLADIYETIASDAPNATIIVMGYPRFFPQNPPLTCYTGLTVAGVPFLFVQPQMAWIDNEIQSMDNTIANAVTYAQNHGYTKVQYVSGSYNAFTGHEMCTADPYYNVAVLPLSQVTASFHPNQSGNAQLAQLAEQAYQAP